MRRQPLRAEPLSSPLRDGLLRRARGLCEACGHALTPPYSQHHRLPRGMGGTSLFADAWSRLVLLHGDGVGGCHGVVESFREWARTRGLLVPRGAEPAAVPLVLPSGRRVLLAEEAPLYVPAPGPPYELDVSIMGWPK